MNWQDYEIILIILNQMTLLYTHTHTEISAQQQQQQLM